jgi:hypothetical protein
MFFRKSDFFFLFIGTSLIVLLLTFVHASIRVEREMPELRSKGRLVEKLHITDLCLFTDARYTRHPSMADLNTPFQDHPMSLEHFPSGTIMTPPRHIYHHGMD